MTKQRKNGVQQNPLRWKVSTYAQSSLLLAAVILIFETIQSYNAASSATSAAISRDEPINKDNETLVIEGMGGGSPSPSCTTMPITRRTPEESEIIFSTLWEKVKNTVTKRELTFLSESALRFHAIHIDEIEQHSIPGIIIECGVAKAGSSLTFAAVKNKCRQLHLHDTFEGIPEPSDRDGKDVHDRYETIQAEKKKCTHDDQILSDDCDEKYYGNIEDLLEFDKLQFQQLGYNLQEHNIYFHKGLFNDTVWPNGTVAYAHLDGDWYDSTKGMLERITPYLSVGGYFVLDDVLTWSGARDAFSDFFDVTVSWLQQQSNQSCYSVVGGKHFKVFLAERAAAKVLATRDRSLIPCIKRSTLNEYIMKNSSYPTERPTRTDLYNTSIDTKFQK